MKKNSLPPNRPSAVMLPLLWAAVHGALALIFALSLAFAGGVRINTNLFDILPESSSLRAVAAAERELSGRTSRGIYILAGHPDFSAAREAAAALYDSLAGSGSFEQISLYVDDSVMAQFTGYLHDYRYMLLSAQDRELLETGGASQIADEALAAAYGAFTFTSLDTIETDPFFLADRELKQFFSSSTSLLSSGAMSLRQDVLAAQHEGTWYVMIRGTLSPSGAAITNKESGVEQIYSVCAAIEAEDTGVSFVFSGVPFHSYESSSGAQREISLITTVSLILIILLFLFIFRSPLPVIASVAAIAVSSLTAIGSVLLVFREMHILTFVFGTTLIGTCIDYSIHFFVHRMGSPAVKSGREIRSQVFRGITLGLVSTEICYAALFFAPFMLLRQFAVFSFAGLLSSWLTVLCLYPSIPFRGWFQRDRAQKWFQRDRAQKASRGKGGTLPGKALIAGIAAVSLCLLLANREKVRVENNIGSLYSMSGRLMESERISAQVLNHGSAGWYFIVAGDTPEEVLENEEALLGRLVPEIEAGNMGSCAAVSLFIPSEKTQRRSYEAAKQLLPLAEAQFAGLGFSGEPLLQETAEVFRAEFFRRDFAAAEGRYVSPQGDIPAYLKDILSNVWIGEAEGRYYSCVLPLHTENEGRFRAIADEFEPVYFVNKVKDIGTELDGLTRIMLLLFLIAYIIIGVVLRFFYSWRDTLRIWSIPFLLVLVTVTVLACLDIPLGFFSVVGLILVFGLGLDYIIYTVESSRSENRGLTVFAIALSFATTALSFGALALSTFIPVHIFGLTVCTGLTTAFICSFLVSLSRSEENQRISG